MDYYTAPHNPQVPPLIAEHIQITPGVCRGRPRIAGHRLLVQDVAIWHEQLGQSPEEIISLDPQSIQEAQDLVNTLKHATLSKLPQKLAARDLRTDALSPGGYR